MLITRRLRQTPLWTCLAVRAVSLSGWICLQCWRTRTRTRTRSGNGPEPVRRASVFQGHAWWGASLPQSYFGFAISWNANEFRGGWFRRWKVWMDLWVVLGFFAKTNGFSVSVKFSVFSAQFCCWRHLQKHFYLLLSETNMEWWTEQIQMKVWFLPPCFEGSYELSCQLMSGPKNLAVFQRKQ